MVSASAPLTAADILNPTNGIYGILIAIILYYAFDWTDTVDFMIKSCWTLVVYLAPSRLVSALDSTFSAARLRQDEGSGSALVYHTEKSNAMRRILRLDNGGVMSFVQRSRAFSNVSPPRTMALPGLGNWDNSCYQNSVLQGLASLRSLPVYLDSPPSQNDDTTRSVLLSLASSLNDKGNKGATLWTPAKLKNMSSWQQQDAQEYFARVLDEVDKDTAQVLGEEKRKRSRQGLSIRDHPLAKPSRRDCPTGSPPSGNEPGLDELPDELKSIVCQNPLEGLLAQRVGCQRCGYVEGLSLVPFTCLTVPLGKDIFYDIRECLNDYTTLESIDGVECAKCTLLSTEAKLREVLLRLGPAQPDTQPVDSQKANLLKSFQERLDLIDDALESQEFTDASLKKCQIGANSKVASTKTKQAVIGRAPQALIIHVNRSQFDELTGALTKNYARVNFPLSFNLGPWYLGHAGTGSALSTEEWNSNPTVSMLPPFDAAEKSNNPDLDYQLRAVVTHYGRHENGHYICYRQAPDQKAEENSEAENKEGDSWWRLSDQQVTEVSEQEMLNQGNVFMLFYERVLASGPGPATPAPPAHDYTTEHHQAPEHVLDVASEPVEPAPSIIGTTCETSVASEADDVAGEGQLHPTRTPDTPTISADTPKAHNHLPQLIPQALPTPPPSPTLADGDGRTMTK